jgi:hypothetical protein
VSDTWVGGGTKDVWNEADNWSTGRVPGPSSDVCVSAFVTVTAYEAVTVHSLVIGSQASVVFTGTKKDPAKVRVSTAVHNEGNLELLSSTLTVPRFDNEGGFEAEDTDTLYSPGLENSGTVSIVQGTLYLEDRLPQIDDGALEGGAWEAADRAILVFPADITDLAHGELTLGPDSEVVNSLGTNALSGLTTVGANALFALSGATVSVSGALTTDGSIELGGYDGGGTLAVGGTLTVQAGEVSMSESTIQATSVVVDAGAGLSGSGALGGKLVNDGSVTPTSTMTVGADFSQGNDGVVGVGLEVAGTASLDGTLVAGGIPPPLPGTRTTAMTFASSTGVFTRHSLGFKLVAETHKLVLIAETQILPSPSSAALGAALNVKGADFASGTSVTLYLNGTAGPVLGTARKSDAGGVTFEVTLPSTTKLGHHELIAKGSDGRQARAGIEVV